ncbi:MAG TPA: hypothetical protein VL025_16575, partial [Thermoanaerobaculia bacterium]|nr:hypothetical protein [Thermoanaerobaculia bacterium]
GLFKHLLICPELGPLPGVIRAGAAAVAEVLEWPLESFHACFAELLREGLVQVDWKAGLIFLVNGIRYTPPNNASQVTGWLRHWNALPDSPLKTIIWERYRAHFEADAERRRKEIRAGLRDKKQDPEALLKAFLEHIAKPGRLATVPPPAAVRRPEATERPARPERNNPGSKGALPRAAEPLPGEDLLAQLAGDLQATHPRGLAGGTDLHDALFRALKSGDLRPDGTAAKPGAQSLTVSELRERHAAWCAAWASGASLPMNLANWINKRRGWHEQPPEARPHTTGPGGSAGAESLAELADRHEESLRTLDWEANA